MFWDKVSGIYDLFGKVYNGRVNRRMCRDVAKEIRTGDRVLECACGTGLITAAVAGKCRELVATDYSEGMLKQTRKKMRIQSKCNNSFCQHIGASFS